MDILQELENRYSSLFNSKGSKKVEAEEALSILLEEDLITEEEAEAVRAGTTAQDFPFMSKRVFAICLTLRYCEVGIADYGENMATALKDYKYIPLGINDLRRYLKGEDLEAQEEAAFERGSKILSVRRCFGLALTFVGAYRRRLLNYLIPYAELDIAMSLCSTPESIPFFLDSAKSRGVDFEEIAKREEPLSEEEKQVYKESVIDLLYLCEYHLISNTDWSKQEEARDKFFEENPEGVIHFEQGSLDEILSLWVLNVMVPVLYKLCIFSGGTATGINVAKEQLSKLLNVIKKKADDQGLIDWSKFGFILEDAKEVLC